MNSRLFGFLGRVTLLHTVTYIVFGVLFLKVIGLYPEYYSNPAISAYIRPTDDPTLTYAPLVQLLRGIIIALGLYPFRKIFISRKYGWALLWGVLIALQVLGAPSGAIENLIYTKMPLWFTLLNTPEVMLQMLVFSVLTFVWEVRIENKGMRKKYLEKSII